MTCPSCGHPAPAGSRFCAWCGTALDATEAAGPGPDQPAPAGWGAAPPPARRRPGPGLLAAAMALVLVFGAIGLVAARSVGASAGARSPESAANGLLGALDKRDLKRAANFLQGEERQLAAVYTNRLAGLLAERQGTGSQLAGLDVTARDLRYHRVATGGDGRVVVLEAVDGTVGVRGPNGSQVQLPVAEARRQLAKQTGGAINSLRLVTVRGSDGRWYVSLLASSAEWGRLAGRASDADYGLLAGGTAAPGAASPDQAVRELVAAATGGDPTKAAARLAPDEARVADAFRQPLLQRLDPGRSGMLFGRAGQPKVRVDGLTTRSEQLAEGVVKVHLTGGTVRVAGKPPASLGDARQSKDLALVTIRQDGGWYPSLLGTAADAAVTEAERAHP
jgi:Double zinc ribbon